MLFGEEDGEGVDELFIFMPCILVYVDFFIGMQIDRRPNFSSRQFRIHHL